MPADTTIGIIVKGGPSADGVVYSSQRLTMTDYPGNSNVLNYDFDDDGAEDSYSSIYVTGPDVCQLDHVDIEGQPSFSWPLYDLFTCAGLNDCSGDTSVLAGNQHTYIAHAYDQGNHEIGADVNNWSVEDPQDVIDTPLPNNVSVADITSLVKNGLAYVKAEATAYGVTKSATAQVRVNLCEHPWPNPFVGEHFPFEDSFNFRQPDTATGNGNIYTNFAISYCKDPGDLPAIESVLVKNGNADINNDNYQELVKEYFFLFAKSDPNNNDVIGIRVMENVQGLSPTEWYRKQFGPAAPEPQALTVDGYPAVRAGRTVYVAAANLICHNDAMAEVDCLDGSAISGRLYNNIYLISYNEGASDETVDIYNRLLQNWEFNVNITRTDREKMWRDMKRLNDLNDIYAKMLDYKTANGHFPQLEGGTFIQGMSTSKWPSWQDTLGAALGGNLPVDPVNDFVNAPEPAPQLCLQANGFNDPNTCWDEGDKDFEAPQNSHLYMYVVGPSGDFANLYTKMEYLGVGSWINYSPTPPEPCDGNSSFCDNVFNFEFLLSGNLQDHAGPNITGVTYQTNDLDGLTVADSGLIEVTANDPSGVNRVEFYINGTRKYTDTEMSDSWIWNFDSGQYADGDYEFIARAYDNMGNRRDRRANFTINNSGGPDSVPPFVQIISHHDGDRVSGTVNLVAVASDNVLVFDTWIRVYRSDEAIPFNPANAIANVMCPSPNADYCTLTWDSIGTPNGNYIVQAEAMDLSFPANDHAFDEVSVVLDNTDTDPPNVALINFSGNGRCALGTCAGNGNTCSVLSIHSCSDGSVCNKDACTSNAECSDLPNPLNPAETLTNSCQMAGVVNVAVSADDTQSNITRVVYSIDGVTRYTDDVADGLGITSSWDWNTEEVSSTNPLVAPPPHNLTITAYDAYGHGGSVSVDTGTFNESTDTIAPTIFFNIPPTPTPDFSTINAPFTISVSATDNLNAVDYVDFYFDYVYRRTVQGPLLQYTYDITQQFLDQLSNGCHTFSARAVDTAGNERNSEVRHIGVRQNCYGESGQGPRVVGDGVNPIVSPHSVRVGDTVTIRARVSDPDYVASVVAYIQNPDEQDPPTATITMTCVDGPCTTSDTRLGIYQGTWVATGSLDPYYVDIVAIDNIGQRSEAENVF
jgi:tetratricopeptide (TPR) repeat protein